jgi:cytidylate kinase
MAIITISRGSASGGLLLAEGLAKRTGYELMSREDIIREAAKSGVSENELKEAILKPLGFWERFQHERRRYLTFVQEALCKRAIKDCIIYHGNAGHLLLQGISHVLCVRLIAPISFRVGMVMKRQSVASEEAIRYVEKLDRQRKDWTSFLYGVDWLDPSLYDLTINLKVLDVEGAVDVVATAVHREEFQTTEESRKAMADLLLASRVRAALAAAADTASAEVDVKAQGDVVYIKGKVRALSMVESVIRVSKSVSGVREVNRKDLDAPDYTV